ncbi:MAG: CPBP family intramembrane metalloprotease [Planctomycetes bacterium]|nr:CPBP family intramembrane metalloprotease [Planctomycetota bacterium]
MRSTRALFATIVIYVGLVIGLLGARSEASALFGKNPVPVLLLVLAVAGLFVLGRGAISEAFGRRPSATWLAIGLAVALVALTISALWVGNALEKPIRLGGLSRIAWQSLAVALIAAYSEELLFRGVLWTAIARRSTTMLRPLIQTSAIFAIAHVIGPAGLAELPHRAIAGVLFGLLRWKSDSLWPGMHAHFCVNAIVMTA